MTKRKSLIYSIISYVVALGLIFAVVILTSRKYYYEPIKVFALFLASAVIFGFLNALLHEVGHIVIGKKNGFKILAFTVWFFKWTKVKNKFVFSFTMIGDEAGYTDSIPISQENMET
ncbi:MAG: hypothetical protein KBS91_04795, partial [Firmicutes bacterium]|nr:hypothetical protein [Candidatus Caballimonas caccae]